MPLSKSPKTKLFAKQFWLHERHLYRLEPENRWNISRFLTATIRKPAIVQLLKINLHFRTRLNLTTRLNYGVLIRLERAYAPKSFYVLFMSFIVILKDLRGQNIDQSVTQKHKPVLPCFNSIHVFYPRNAAKISLKTRFNLEFEVTFNFSLYPYMNNNKNQNAPKKKEKF